MIWLILQGALVGWLTSRVFPPVDGWPTMEVLIVLAVNSILIVLYGARRR